MGLNHAVIIVIISLICFEIAHSGMPARKPPRDPRMPEGNPPRASRSRTPARNPPEGNPPRASRSRTPARNPPAGNPPRASRSRTPARNPPAGTPPRASRTSAGNPPAGNPPSASTKVCPTTSASSSKSVTINEAANTRTVQATGCPGYDWTSRKNPGDATYQCYSFVFPLAPTINSGVTPVGAYLDVQQTQKNSQPPGGPIGIASNGIPIFGNSDSQGRDAYVYEGVSFDNCGGHPQQQGAYHYHSAPQDGCVYSSTSGKHDDLFGFMADGIPIFGPLGDGGVVPKNLDACNGHVDTSYPFYHYHVTANYKYPYIINCLKGCVDTSNWPTLRNIAPACTAASKQYNYTSLYQVWKRNPSYSCNTQ